MFTSLSHLAGRIRAFFHSRQLDGDFNQELESHIAMLVEDNIRRGMTPAEARREALLRLGGRASLMEQHRAVRGLPFLDVLSQDLRYAARVIRRNPAFATVAVLSLAIGIAANTAIFSLVNAVILHPLAYRDPQQLFAVGELSFTNGAQLPNLVNPMHAKEWEKECPSLEQVGLLRGSSLQLAGGAEPVTMIGADVSHNLFALFGVEPILGRAFLAEEEQEGNDRVVILSESLWRSRFNSDRSVLGSSIVINGVNRQVVGILPASFRLPRSTNSSVDIFRPLVLQREEIGRVSGNFNYGGFIRVRHGVNPEQARAEMNVVEARYPQPAVANMELKAKLTPVYEIVTGRARLGLWMLAAAVGAVLLIVCINLANLQLSRIASRSREVAIRTALGASRMRQFRQVLSESLLLAWCGGFLGIVFARWIVQLLVATTTLDLPRLDEARLDGGVLLFALSVACITGLLFGVLPAWRLTGDDPQAALRAGSHTVTEGRSGLRLREGLISLEVGVSTALLIAAGLLATSLIRLLGVDKGFDVDHVLTVDVSLAGAGYSDPERREQYFNRLLEKLAALPGAEASGFVTYLPTRGETWQDPIYLEGDGAEHHSVNNRYASPGYFRSMNIGVRQGRLFEVTDRGQSVAVLSQKATRLLWPDDPNPVGRRFIGEDGQVQTLVGIVADVRAQLQTEPPPMAYYPYWQRIPAGGVVVVRATGDPMALAGIVRGTLRSEDPQLAIPATRTMSEVLERSVAQRRFQFILMSGFAASALLVASLGIYGVVSYSVARRRTEIGVRMALGAQRSRLLRLVIRQGMTPVGVGLILGVTAGLILARSIRGLLFGVQPVDFPTIGGVVVVLLVVATIACFIPARRAAGTDIVAALRTE